MKRLCVILLAIVIVFTGCSKPERMWEASTVAEDILPYAEKAVKAIEDYVDNKIDEKQADAVFAEIIEDMEALNIYLLYAQEGHSVADVNIYDRTLRIGRGVKLDKQPKEYFEKYLALFNFQISGKPSDKFYPTDQFFSVNYCKAEDVLGDLYPKVNDLFADAESESYSYARVTFDYINGVKLKDFFSYVKKLNSNLIETGKLKNLHVEYRCYDQHVISVSIRAQVGEPDISYWMFGRNYDCDDMSEVKAAIKKAEKAFPYR